jgi:hypothetical protein
MGASASSSVNKVHELNESDLNMTQETFNRISNQCKSSSNQNNILNIIGSTVTKLTTNQKNAAQNMCVLKTALNTIKESESKNALLSAIKENLEQKTTAGLGLSVSSNVSLTDRTNLFKLKDSKRTVNEAITGCINSMDQENVINIIGSTVTEADMAQANDVMMECLSNYGVVDQQAAATASDTKVETEKTAVQETKGYDPVAALGGVAGVYLSVCCFICCSSIISSVAGGLMAQGGEGGFPEIPGFPKLPSLGGMKIPGMPKLPF